MTCTTDWADVEAELPALVTPDQLAETLAVSVTTLQDWRYKKVGPTPKKVGKRAIRYLRSDVLEWLKNQ